MNRYNQAYRVSSGSKGASAGVEERPLELGPAGPTPVCLLDKQEEGQSRQREQHHNTNRKRKCGLFDAL